MTISHTVPKGLCLALFKGTRPGLEGFYNRVGRFLDHGPYSHCELVFSDRVSASSSAFDKGVRFKQIGYSSVGNWDFLPIPDPDNTLEHCSRVWFASREGMPYDILGNIRFALGAVRDSKDRWFCSEAAMASLGFDEPFRYGPSGMASLLPRWFKSQIVEVSSVR